MAMISTVLRERARKQELENMKERIKSKLPVLSKREVRRFRIPFYQALCLELDEDGFHEGASFLRILINYQAKLREDEGPESFFWFYPQLCNEKQELIILYEGLKAAETGKQAGM